MASDLHRRLEVRAEELDINVKRAKGWLAVPADVAANLGNFAVELHGVDLNGNGIYDGGPSDLDPSVPFEATAPAGCGKIVPAAAGQLASTGGPPLLPLAGALLLWAGIVGTGTASAIAGVRRRRPS